LQFLAAEDDEDVALAGRLGALGHHAQAQFMGEADDGADDGLGILAGLAVGDEAAVDLELRGGHWHR
jgi:hypothetical protein